MNIEFKRLLITRQREGWSFQFRPNPPRVRGTQILAAGPYASLRLGLDALLNPSGGHPLPGALDDLEELRRVAMDMKWDDAKIAERFGVA